MKRVSFAYTPTEQWVLGIMIFNGYVYLSIGFLCFNIIIKKKRRK